MTAAILWQSVVDNYDLAGLVSLTNIRDRASKTVDTAVGESAAQEVIHLWPVYAEESLDVTNGPALAVARHGVIAVLWRRGGSAQEISRVEWEHVFGEGGMVQSYMAGEARARIVPRSNSGVVQKTETRRRGWSDEASLPPGYLPSDTGTQLD